MGVDPGASQLASTWYVPHDAWRPIKACAAGADQRVRLLFGRGGDVIGMGGRSPQMHRWTRNTDRQPFGRPARVHDLGTSLDKGSAAAPRRLPPSAVASGRWGAPVVAVMWPTVEGSATPRRRPQSKQVPPWRTRSSVALIDPQRLSSINLFCTAKVLLFDHLVVGPVGNYSAQAVLQRPGSQPGLAIAAGRFLMCQALVDLEPLRRAAIRAAPLNPINAPSPEPIANATTSQPMSVAHI
jgi:hypothetical protein